MSECAQGTEVDGSYGELLGQYFSVAAEIAPMLDGFGRPDPEYWLEYSQLSTRRASIRESLRREASDIEQSEIEAILDDAFSDH